MPTLPGHQRNVSQGQHLIVDRTDSGDEEDVERCSGTRTPPISQGVYPGGSPTHEHCRPQDNKAKGLCSDPQIRANVRVILGSIVLTIVGAILLVFGVVTWVNNSGEGTKIGVLFFAGSVCFIPGFYHVFYIFCTLCGRPGYSFDKLPTFNR